MPDDLVNVYEAETLAEASLLADRLKEAGIQVFIDNSDSPFDGLTLGDQRKPVRVLPDDAQRAHAIAEAFVAEVGSSKKEDE